MTQRQKAIFGHLLVEGVLLIRQIWVNATTDNKQAFKEIAAKLIGEIDDEMNDDED